MKTVGCDLHAKQQSIAMVDTETGEFTEKTLSHEGNGVREFYAALEARSRGNVLSVSRLVKCEPLEWYGGDDIPCGFDRYRTSEASGLSLRQALIYHRNDLGGVF